MANLVSLDKGLHTHLSPHSVVHTLSSLHIVVCTLSPLHGGLCTPSCLHNAALLHKTISLQSVVHMMKIPHKLSDPAQVWLSFLEKSVLLELILSSLLPILV